MTATTSFAQQTDEQLQREFATKIKRAVVERPFQLAPDSSVAVRLETATLTDVKISDYTSTVLRIEFVDRSGRVLHTEQFPTEVQSGGNGIHGFREACEVHVKERAFPRYQPRFIQITFDCSPSAPGYTRLRWYGIDSAKRFRAVKSPFDGFQGQLTRHADYPGLDPERLYATIHTGYTSVIVPLEFDPASFSLKPDFGQRYLIASGPAFRPQSPLNLTLRDRPAGQVTAVVTVTATTENQFRQVLVEDGPLGELPSDWISVAPWAEIEVAGKRGWVNLRDDPGLRQALLWSG